MSHTYTETKLKYQDSTGASHSIYRASGYYENIDILVIRKQAIGLDVEDISSSVWFPFFYQGIQVGAISSPYQDDPYAIICFKDDPTPTMKGFHYDEWLQRTVLNITVIHDNSAYQSVHNEYYVLPLVSPIVFEGQYTLTNYAIGIVQIS